MPSNSREIQSSNAQNFPRCKKWGGLFLVALFALVVLNAGRVAAQKVATALKVKFVFYKIESLHDRFLVVGERIWHVGCSFNQLGQEISAVVEMRDDRVKHSVLDLFDSVRKRTPEFEVLP